MTTASPNGEPTPSGAGPGFSALEGLRKIEERFRLAVQAGKMFVYEWDLETDAVELFGECAYVLGVNEAAFTTGRQLFSKVHPDDREILTTALAGLTAEEPQIQISHRIVHPDRGVILVETNGHACLDEAGRMLRITGMVADITVRKQAEIELAMANDLLHLAKEARRKDMELKEVQRLAGVGSWQWDPENDTVIWSDELYRITGRDPDLPAVRYREHSQLYTADSWIRLQHAVEEALQTGAPYELDLEMIRADGTSR